MTGALSHPAYGVLRPVTATASVLLADNPSAMTLDGTNSWVLRAPGTDACVVVDPGPDDHAHLDRLAALGPVELVLITHWHPDHTAGIDRFVELTGAPVRALDERYCVRAEPLREAERISVAGLGVTVLATPGHTADSVSFLLSGPEPAVLTGDTVLGSGTTVIAHPDGTLGAYLTSLRRLSELPDGTRLLPAHGPDHLDAATLARAYLAHREQRLNQVRGALAELGPDTNARAVVELVYADVDRVLWPAAESSVEAQLAYLRGTES